MAQELFVTTLFNDANLVHYYRMEGNSNDSIGSLNGTDTSITYNTSNGKFNQGAGFNGTTSNQAFSSSMHTGSGNFTIIGWVKTSTSGATQVILSYGASTTNNGIIFFINTSNKIEMDLSNTGGPSSTSIVTDGNWHQVAVTNTGGTIQLYIDGATSGASQVMSPNISAGTSNTSKDFFASAGFLTGDIDDLAVFTRALSTAEISGLYNGTLTNRLAGGAFLLNLL